METIGDNIMAILGIIPVRDRAGIPRSNLAVEAAKSKQATDQMMSGPQASMQMPQAPPQFKPPQELIGQNGQLQLPEEVPTDYASGKAPRPPAPKAGLSAPLAEAPVIPAGRERVIESSPAAAPSQPLQRQASDIYAEAVAQNARRQKMMQVFGSLAMMANAFNRHPDAGQTTAQLAGMVGGAGGHGGGGGNDLASLKTILELRKGEQSEAASAAARQRSIDALVAQGVPREQAIVETDNNLHTQRLGLAGEQAREAIRRDEQIRKDLDNPAAIAELAQMYHMTPAQMQTAIRNGTVSKFTDPAILAEVRDKHAQSAEREQKTAITGADFASREEARRNPEAVAARYSAKLGRPVNAGEVLMGASTEDGWKKFNEENLATGQAGIASTRSQTNERIAKTDEEVRSTEQKRKADTAHAFYKDNPEAFARLHNLKDVDEARRIVDDRKAYDKYQETSGPSAYAGTAAYHDYERAERAAGRTPLGRLEFEQAKEKAKVPVPEDIITTESAKAAREQMHKSSEEARQAAENVRARHMLQDQWRPDLISGGQLAEKQTEWRSTVAQLFNMPDEQARDTKVFFSALNKNVQAAAKSLPGAFSNNDLLFMKDLEGGQTLDAQGIRKLQIIHEKMELAKMAKHDKYFESQTAKPSLAKLKEYYDKAEVIEPGRFIREELQANPHHIDALMKNPTPAEKAAFDREYGYGRANWIIERGGKLE